MEFNGVMSSGHFRDVLVQVRDDVGKAQSHIEVEFELQHSELALRAVLCVYQLEGGGRANASLQVVSGTSGGLVTLNIEAHIERKSFIDLKKVVMMRTCMAPEMTQIHFNIPNLNSMHLGEWKDIGANEPYDLPVDGLSFTYGNRNAKLGRR